MILLSNFLKTANIKMYVKKVVIENIRSIEHFEMEFPNPAGWHVLIGENGSGKSTIVKAIALTFLNNKDLAASTQDWNDWVSNNKFKHDHTCAIMLDTFEPFVLNQSESYSRQIIHLIPEDNQLEKKYTFHKSQSSVESNKFYAAYGPFRRFTGGNPEKEKIFKTNPNLGAVLSIFGEDVALPEALSYLINLYTQNLENKDKKKPIDKTLDYIKKFINEAKLLPHNAKIEDVELSGVYFRDGNGNRVNLLQMSDGFRSILSLTLDLIRQLVRVYGSEKVFEQIARNNYVIDCEGVVLIDEVDAHLHPTWQVEIGKWLTKYFPKIQFIVTTHSPLVCRAAEKGSIWRLASPDSKQTTGKIEGIEKDKLVKGNILDAYGTELFGQSPVTSEKADKSLKRLGKLNMLAALGKASQEEENERLKLQAIFSTDASFAK